MYAAILKPRIHGVGRHVVLAITAPNQKKQLSAMSPAGDRALM